MDAEAALKRVEDEGLSVHRRTGTPTGVKPWMVSGPFAFITGYGNTLPEALADYDKAKGA